MNIRFLKNFVTRLSRSIFNNQVRQCDFHNWCKQCAEGEAFKGMKTTFKSNPNIKIIFEAWEFDNHLKNARKILTKHGFDVISIGEGQLDGSQGNFLPIKRGDDNK